MQPKTLLVALLATFTEARFSQEQIPIPAIQAVTSGGGPGVAATLAGSAISTLLGAANPCLKLQKADEIIKQLGTGADAVAAAIGLVSAEQNFNPFAVDRPFICGDPTLPKTEILRGITPLVDPAVDGSAAANALSARSKTAPLDAVGKSVAQVMADNGFATLVAKDLAGNVVEIGAGAGGGGDVDTEVPAEEAPVGEAPAETDIEEVVTQTVVPVVPSTAPACDAVTSFITVTRGAAASSAAPAQTEAPAIPVTGDSPDAEAPPTGGNNQVADGADFGLCTPTIDFLPGRNGRKATEFTFQATDPLVNKGQQEALNPNIITNRICDQLTNVCEANQAAKDLCQSVKAQVLESGLRDASVVETWNAALGFAGAVAPPPPAEGPATGGNNGNGNGAGNGNGMGNGNGNGNGNNGNGNGNGGTADGEADFGVCTPTIDFLPGRNGRKATEFTFQAIDPQISAAQSEALNPNIITNRICDELTNQCQANQAAKDLCQSAKASILASGLRDASVVDSWNGLLGF